MRSRTVYIAAGGELSIKTADIYTPGSGTLFVYLNGILQSLGAAEDYVETDGWTITFNVPLVQDDRVTIVDLSDDPTQMAPSTLPTITDQTKMIYEFVYPVYDNTANEIRFWPVNPLQGMILVFMDGKQVPIAYNVKTEADPKNPTLIMTYITVPGITMNDYIIVQTSSQQSIVVGDYGNPIYKRYWSTIRLLGDQIYTGHLEDSSQQLNVDFKFTSRYDPLYCTTKMVREDIEAIVTLTDEEINFIIYNNSMKILTDMQGAGDVNYNLPVPYYLRDPAKIPYNIQMHVRYQTDLDILNAVYLSMTGKQGLVSKKLANMQIDREVRLPYLKDYLQRYEVKLRQYPPKLANRAVIKSATKGESSEPWPVASPRRSF